MNWHDRLQYIQEMYAAQASVRSALKYYPPATGAEIKSLEDILGNPLPSSLRSLLLESNGVLETIEIRGELITNMWLFWPTDMIASENLALRRTAGLVIGTQTPQDLLFFANAGSDGIQFAFQISGEQENTTKIYVWYPMEQIFTVVATSLEEFAEHWYSGNLKV